MEISYKAHDSYLGECTHSRTVCQSVIIRGYHVNLPLDTMMEEFREVA